jgi:hypothetical protein
MDSQELRTITDSEDARLRKIAEAEKDRPPVKAESGPPKPKRGRWDYSSSRRALSNDR